MLHLKVRFLRVLWAKECLSRLVSGELLINAINSVGDVLETFHEQLAALLLNSLKIGLCLFSSLSNRLKIFVCFGQLLSSFI